MSEWRSPWNADAPFRKVVVLVFTKEEGLRRTFEDEFVAKLEAAGVDAVASYQYVAQETSAEEEDIRAATREAGADAALVSRLVTVTRRAQYSGALQPVPVLGYGRRCCGGWVWHSAPYQYDDVYIAETSLYGAAHTELAWSGMTRTYAPGRVRREMREFAGVIVESLKKDRLI